MQADIGNHEDWKQPVVNWHFCDRGHYAGKHLQENVKTGQCECQTGYFKLVNQQNPAQFTCEACPAGTDHTADQLSCVCKGDHQVFDVVQKKCVCVDNTVMVNGVCSCKT